MWTYVDWRSSAIADEVELEKYMITTPETRSYSKFVTIPPSFEKTRSRTFGISPGL